MKFVTGVRQSIQVVFTSALLATATGHASADSRNGAWGPLHAWPLMPIHSVVMRDGRVLTFGTDTDGQQNGSLVYDIWDPELGYGPASHQTLANTTSTDIFCAGMVNLPRSGNVITVGGDDNMINSNESSDEVSLFSPDTNSIRPGPGMSWKRWYPTTVVLPNDRLLVHGGRQSEATFEPATTPEIFNPGLYGYGGTWSALTGATSENLYSNSETRWFYPRSWVAPNGRVFTITGKTHFWLDPRGDGRTYSAGRVGTQYTSIYSSSTAVMYGRGKIMQSGGGDNSRNASRQVMLIDINSGAANFSRSGNMVLPRHWADATLLPDGRVLVNGGSQVIQQLSNTVGYKPEIWDPARLRSTLMNVPEERARLYHSSSVLLSDGRVLSAGGGTPGPQTNLNAQIYSPPYLFDNEGGLLPRPSIVSVASVAPYDSTLNVAVDQNGAGPITRATLIKTGAATHATNMEQRIIELPIVSYSEGIRIRTPANSRLATPGYYHLFLIASNGAPSVSRIIQLDRRMSKRPAIAVNLVSDSSFESIVGVAPGASEVLAQGAYFGGWQVMRGQVAVNHHDYQELGRPTSSAKPNGTQHISLNGGSIGRIRQIVDGLLPGESYAIEFSAAKHRATSVAQGRVQIGTLDETIQTTSDGNVAWSRHSYTFTASARSMPLTLTGRGPQVCCGLLIDDVRIRHLP